MVLPMFFGGAAAAFVPKFATWSGLNVAQFSGTRWKAGTVGGGLAVVGPYIKRATDYFAADNTYGAEKAAISSDGLTNWVALPNFRPATATGAGSNCGVVSAAYGGGILVVTLQIGYWGGCGTYTSTDGGASWTWTNLTSLLQVTGGQTEPTQINYRNGKFWLSSVCNNHDASAYGSACAYSSNGLAWTKVGDANGGRNSSITADGYFVDAGGGWVGGNGALHYATDPAGTWATSTAPMPTYPASGDMGWYWNIAPSPFVDFDQGYYIALCRYVPYRSNSLTGTWSTTGMPTAVAYGVAAKTGHIILRDGPGAKIWVSSDGGGAWANSLCPITPGNICKI